VYLYRGNTSAGANILLQGVDPGFHSVPLHRINLKLYFVLGQAVVGIRCMIPVEDSSLLRIVRCYLVSIWPLTTL
jgi:hypothetical protein